MDNQAFQVDGMTCGHCVRAVQEAIQELDPQAQVAVDLDAGKIDVQSGQPRPALAQAIEDAGYRVQP